MQHAIHNGAQQQTAVYSIIYMYCSLTSASPAAATFATFVAAPPLAPPANRWNTYVHCDHHAYGTRYTHYTAAPAAGAEHGSRQSQQPMKPSSATLHAVLSSSCSFSALARCTSCGATPAIIDVAIISQQQGVCGDGVFGDCFAARSTAAAAVAVAAAGGCARGREE